MTPHVVYSGCSHLLGGKTLAYKQSYLSSRYNLVGFLLGSATAETMSRTLFVHETLQGFLGMHRDLSRTRENDTFPGRFRPMGKVFIRRMYYRHSSKKSHSGASISRTS